MPPAYVKLHVKRGKTDAADPEAICEAVTRPIMRFAAVKSIDQQAVLMLHKTRDLLVRQRTALINAHGLVGNGCSLGGGNDRCFAVDPDPDRGTGARAVLARGTDLTAVP